MTLCEVCGTDQYPSNTVVRHDAAFDRHFFCSVQHAEAWERGEKPYEAQMPGQMDIEEVLSEAGTVLEEHKEGLPVPEEAATAAAKVLSHGRGRGKSQGRAPKTGS